MEPTQVIDISGGNDESSSKASVTKYLSMGSTIASSLVDLNQSASTLNDEEVRKRSNRRWAVSSSTSKLEDVPLLGLPPKCKSVGGKKQKAVFRRRNSIESTSTVQAFSSTETSILATSKKEKLASLGRALARTNTQDGAAQKANFRRCKSMDTSSALRASVSTEKVQSLLSLVQIKKEVSEQDNTKSENTLQGFATGNARRHMGLSRQSGSVRRSRSNPGLLIQEAEKEGKDDNKSHKAGSKIDTSEQDATKSMGNTMSHMGLSLQNGSVRRSRSNAESENPARSQMGLSLQNGSVRRRRSNPGHLLQEAQKDDKSHKDKTSSRKKAKSPVRRSKSNPRQASSEPGGEKNSKSSTRIRSKGSSSKGSSSKNEKSKSLSKSMRRHKSHDMDGTTKKDTAYRRCKSMDAGKVTQQSISAEDINKASSKNKESKQSNAKFKGESEKSFMDRSRSSSNKAQRTRRQLSMDNKHSTSSSETPQLSSRLGRRSITRIGSGTSLSASEIVSSTRTSRSSRRSRIALSREATLDKMCASERNSSTRRASPDDPPTSLAKPTTVTDISKSEKINSTRISKDLDLKVPETPQGFRLSNSNGRSALSCGSATIVRRSIRGGSRTSASMSASMSCGSARRMTRNGSVSGFQLLQALDQKPTMPNDLDSDSESDEESEDKKEEVQKTRDLEKISKLDRLEQRSRDSIFSQQQQQDTLAMLSDSSFEQSFSALDDSMNDSRRSLRIGGMDRSQRSMTDSFNSSASSLGLNSSASGGLLVIPMVEATQPPQPKGQRASLPNSKINRLVAAAQTPRKQRVCSQGLYDLDSDSESEDEALTGTSK